MNSLADMDPVDICPEYDNGTPLHIAAANLSEAAIQALLLHGASKTIKDNKGRTPVGVNNML